jgi:hypothetical protein
MKKTYIFIVFLFLAFFYFPCFGDDSHTPAPYTENEFPQFMKDLRRTEIITLGSMPFITLDTTFAYSLIRYWQNDFSSAYTPNPFAKTSDSNGFSENEQRGILLTSFCICAGIGLTDLTFNLIKRAIGNRKEINEKRNIKITPIEEDKDAVKLPPPLSEDTRMQIDTISTEEDQKNITK